MWPVVATFLRFRWTRFILNYITSLVSDYDSISGINRLDQLSVGTHGWQVRIQRKGVRYGRFFSDSAWGGTREAFEKAVQYREKILSHSRRLREGNTASARSRAIPDQRNRSGAVGVTRILQRTNGVEYRFWQASWTSPDGSREIIRFSVLKFGNSKAFELACEARREAMGGE